MLSKSTQYFRNCPRGGFFESAGDMLAFYGLRCRSCLAGSIEDRVEGRAGAGPKPCLPQGSESGFAEGGTIPFKKDGGAHANQRTPSSLEEALHCPTRHDPR
jgi:hypothetical protein